MNILEKLFGAKAKTENSSLKGTEFQPTVIDSQSESIPPFDLFIDNEAPKLEQEVITESKSRITAFLNRNFLSIGSNDGYEYHSNETLETAKKKIRAEFQLIIDKMIQEKSEKRLQLKMMMVSVDKIANETTRKLELTIEELNSSITILQNQKELSAEDEGWVMNAIHSYQHGFLQGLNDYIAGEDLLNSIINI